MITNIIQKYKLSYHDMIYILKINKMSFYYRITNSDLTLIKNIIDKYQNLYQNHKDYIIIMKRSCLDKSYQELESSFLEIMKKITVKEN